MCYKKQGKRRDGNAHRMKEKNKRNGTVKKLVTAIEWEQECISNETEKSRRNEEYPNNNNNIKNVILDIDTHSPAQFRQAVVHDPMQQQPILPTQLQKRHIHNQLRKPKCIIANVNTESRIQKNRMEAKPDKHSQATHCGKRKTDQGHSSLWLL